MDRLISGTYYHPNLIPHIAYWVSPSFALWVGPNPMEKEIVFYVDKLWQDNGGWSMIVSVGDFNEVVVTF